MLKVLKEYPREISFYGNSSGYCTKNFTECAFVQAILKLDTLPLQHYELLLKP